MRQELDARIHSSGEARRNQLAGVNHTIDTVTNMQSVIERLQMDVGRAQVDHAANNGVDQADNRRFTSQVFKVFDKIAAVGAVAKTVITLFDGLFDRLGKGFLNIAL